jgi:hypothetical protein
MKNFIFLNMLVIFFTANLFSAETFFGTSISISATGTGLNNQSAIIINGKWVWNIDKFFEIGVVYSRLYTNVNADFIDDISKTEPLVYLTYGGMDLGFYPYYGDIFTVRTGVVLAGGGFTYISKDNNKINPYTENNIGVFEPQLEFGYFFSESWQIALSLAYRYIDIDKTEFSSIGTGLGVKYGIFK